MGGRGPTCSVSQTENKGGRGLRSTESRGPATPPPPAGSESGLGLNSSHTGEARELAAWDTPKCGMGEVRIWRDRGVVRYRGGLLGDRWGSAGERTGLPPQPRPSPGHQAYSSSGRLNLRRGGARRKRRVAVLLEGGSLSEDPWRRRLRSLRVRTGGKLPGAATGAVPGALEGSQAILLGHLQHGLEVDS